MSDIAYKVIVNNNGIDDIIFKTIMIKGNDGSSIASIEKTSTAGNVDTYTIYLTDGTIGGTFTVTNSDASSLENLTDVTIASASDGQALIYDATAGKWKNGDIAQSIDNLTDVDISSLAEGDMLIYDATTGKWTNGQTPDELSELDDVDITDAQTGESLIYDGVNQKWVNGNPSQSLAGLDDVDVASAQDGDVLKYNATTGTWEDGAITVSESLDDLSDVEIDSATAGQALIYDQTTGKWVNGAVSSVGALDDLTDVNISNAQDNQELVYDDASSEWQNKSTRIECTQAEYDALVLAGTVLPNVDYYITDAGGGEIVSANPNISDAYDSTHNYVAGDLCIHDDVLYKANASTTGAWDSSKWVRVTIDELLATKQNALSVSTGTVTPTTASTGVELLRSTLLKYGNLKILSVIFRTTGSGSIAFDLSSGFEASYNVDFCAGDDAGKTSRYRIQSGHARVECFATPTLNSYTTFTVAYI